MYYLRNYVQSLILSFDIHFEVKHFLHEGVKCWDNVTGTVNSVTTFGQPRDSSSAVGSGF